MTMKRESLWGFFCLPYRQNPLSNVLGPQDWNGYLEVILLNDSEIHVAECICPNNHPHDCVDQNSHGNEDVVVVVLESLIHFEVHPTQNIFVSIGGHSEISCLRELVCVVLNDTICKSKSNSKPTCGHAKTHGSMIHWHVLLTLQMSVKRQKLLTKKSIKEVATMDCCIHCCC